MPRLEYPIVTNDRNTSQGEKRNSDRNADDDVAKTRALLRRGNCSLSWNTTMSLRRHTTWRGLSPVLLMLQI